MKVSGVIVISKERCAAIVMDTNTKKMTEKKGVGNTALHTTHTKRKQGECSGSGSQGEPGEAKMTYQPPVQPAFSKVFSAQSPAMFYTAHWIS